MTLKKFILFLAIFSNIKCIWQRGTGLAPAFQDRGLMVLVMIRYQDLVDITEKSDQNEYEKENEDHRIRLLRKRAEATRGKNNRIL